MWAIQVFAECIHPGTAFCYSPTGVSLQQSHGIYDSDYDYDFEVDCWVWKAVESAELPYYWRAEFEHCRAGQCMR